MIVTDRPIGIAVIGGRVSEGWGRMGTGRTMHTLGACLAGRRPLFRGAPWVPQQRDGEATSVYYGQCVQDGVPEDDVDLVIVEFTVNDKQLLGVESKEAEESGR